MTHPLLKTLISEMVENYLAENIPPTTHNGRRRVLSGSVNRVIRQNQVFFNPIQKTYKDRSGKEVGHKYKGSIFMDDDFIKKHNIGISTNAHFD